ncbi:hypothetical protein LVW14_19470, partial [Klebsiella pneumoniae]|nr:hypothetical protein [Klebsiella pneumoniae]
SDGNGSHASTLKSPSYTKSVSWQHYRIADEILEGLLSEARQKIPMKRGHSPHRITLSKPVATSLANEAGFQSSPGF